MNHLVLTAGRMLIVLAGTALPALSQAQTSGDPTKPAPAWLALQPKPPGAPVEVERGTPGAQIVIVGPARKFAMVDGEAVRMGETYKGSKLLSVGPDGVIWQTDGHRELTTMTPGVVKTDPAIRQSKQPGAKPGQKH